MDEVIHELDVHSVEIHIVLSGALPVAMLMPEFGELEARLIEEMLSARLAQYTGNEFGGGEAVYVFDVQSLLAFMAKAKEMLGKRNRLTGSYAVVDPGTLGERRSEQAVYIPPQFVIRVVNARDVSCLEPNHY